MIALVDYDNVDSADRRRGVEHVLSRVIHLFGHDRLRTSPRIRFRLYGGWFEEARLSSSGQKISSEIQIYPKVHSVSEGNSTHRLIVNVEMAESMLIDPQVSIPYTFRLKSVPYNLKCAIPPFHGCVDAVGCPIRGTRHLIKKERCPTTGCATSIRDVLSRAEQKLVDTMMVADLLYLSTREEYPVIAVVSSDEDLWPGIKSALLMGKSMLHVHPKHGRSTPVHYRTVPNTTYTELSF